MPPHLNIYVISRARTLAAIERFLSAYVDRAASEDRGDEEIMMVALDPSNRPTKGDDDWDWEPSKNLTRVIERGLQYPRRAFSVYLKVRDSSLAGAILAFDVDNQVIFGLSVDDEGARSKNLERAKALLHEMAEEFGATYGFIGVEEPPPLRGKQEPPKMLVYSWVADSRS